MENSVYCIIIANGSNPSESTVIREETIAYGTTVISEIVETVTVCTVHMVFLGIFANKDLGRI